MAHDVISSGADVETTAQVVVGLFTHASDAHQALAQLRAQGFNSNQIGAAFRTRAHDSYLSDADSSSLSAPVAGEQESWWDKVKDAFRGDDTTTDGRAARGFAVEPDSYSRTDHEYDYADNEFEGSLAGTGISNRARCFSHSESQSGWRDCDRA